MKIQIDHVDLFEIADWQMNLLASETNVDNLDADIKRRLQWSISHIIDIIYEDFEKKWIKILRNDVSVTSIPASRQAFVEMIIARSDYQDAEAISSG